MWTLRTRFRVPLRRARGVADCGCGAGVEAQTVANVHLANKQGLTLIPVVNKIDLPNADIPAVLKQVEDIISIPADEAVMASAKNGIGIDDILEAVVKRIPAPRGKKRISCGR